MKYSAELKNLGELSKTRKISNYIRIGSKLRDKLIFETNFLDETVNCKNRLYYVINDIFESVVCPKCRLPSSIKYIKTKYVIKYCSFSCNVTHVDPAIGKSKAKIIALKSASTMSKMDLITGLSIYDKSKIKIKNSLNKIQESGLTKAQEGGAKSKETNSMINENTGLSTYQNNRFKQLKTLKNNVNPTTGLTLFEEMNNRQANTKRLVKFSTMLEELYIMNFTLLTTQKEYLNGQTRNIKYQCNKCNSIRYSSYCYIRCTKCQPYNKSIGENEVLEFCKLFSNMTDSNTRFIIKPLELDIYIPDHKLAIEYNGLFWHSSYSIMSEDKDYHLHKTQECEKQGIQLFHIFENEWQDPIKQRIWKSIIRNRLGKSNRIFARKTEVRSVSSAEKSEFLISNHLQGDCVSSVNIGLYLGDELASLMTFGKSRYDKKIEWELLRFCNKIGHSVVGGASKLLKSFRKENSGSIISYADKRRSNGNLYKHLGFEFSHESNPNYFYYKDHMELESRIGYQKHKLKDKLDRFDPTLTESENMYRNGFRKIYDCGNQVWILN